VDFIIKRVQTRQEGKSLQNPIDGRPKTSKSTGTNASGTPLRQEVKGEAQTITLTVAKK
jgi:hypothetical protein